MIHTLLPLICMPVMSSLLMWTDMPSGRPGRGHLCTGVGVIARPTVSLGFCTEIKSLKEVLL